MYAYKALAQDVLLSDEHLEDVAQCKTDTTILTLRLLAALVLALADIRERLEELEDPGPPVEVIYANGIGVD